MEVASTGFSIEFLCGSDIAHRFKELQKNAKVIKIAVAYLNKGGYDLIQRPLRDFLLKKKGSLKIIVGLSEYYLTDVEPLLNLFELNRMTRKEQVNIRYFSSKSFHPKFIIFKGKRVWSVILGSSNFTGGGMESNVEANLLLRSYGSIDLQVKRIDMFFDSLWDRETGGARELNLDRLREYAKDKTEFERHFSNQTVLLKSLRRADVPRMLARVSQRETRPFTIFLDGEPVETRHLFGECVLCKSMVRIPKA